MEFDIEDIDIDEVASLARLELTDEEREVLGGQLRSILAHVDQLATIDTTGVAATRHPIHLETPFREDVVGRHLSNADALDNAPERDGPSFVVPRVI